MQQHRQEHAAVGARVQPSKRHGHRGHLQHEYRKGLPIGIAIEAQARVTLGRYYSYRIRVGSDQPLIQRGIYRHIRHPAYLGTILGCVATPLVFHSIYGFALMLLLIPCLLYRIRMEEALLVASFGEDYKAYMAHTWKLVPHVY